MDRSLVLARAGSDRRELMTAIVRYSLAISAAGRIAEAAALLEPARDEYRDLIETPEYVGLAAELARAYLLLARIEDALQVVDDILPTAEHLELHRETLELLVTRGPALASMGRLLEAIVTLVGAVASSASYGLTDVEIRARVNLSFAAAGEDPQLAYRVAREGLELVRHYGMHGWFYMLGNAAELAIRLGDWDWALHEVEELAVIETDMTAKLRRAEIRGFRGIDVSDDLRAIAEGVAEMTEVQAVATVDEVRAVVAFGLGDDRQALDLARRSYANHIAPDATAIQTAIRAAARLADIQAVRDALLVIDGQPGRVPAAIRCEGDAALAALEGRRGESLAGFLDALRRWRELGLDFEAAVCALGLVTLLGPSEPEVRAAGELAGALFERLGAKPFQDALADAMGAAVPAAAPRRDGTRIDAARAQAARADRGP